MRTLIEKVAMLKQNYVNFNKAITGLEVQIVDLEEQGKVKQANKKRNKLKDVLETFIANLENQKIW